MPDSEPTKGRVRRWLDRRRQGQRRAAEMTRRAKETRRQDFDKATRHGNIGSGDPGPFGR